MIEIVLYFIASYWIVLAGACTAYLARDREQWLKLPLIKLTVIAAPLALIGILGQIAFLALTESPFPIRSFGIFMVVLAVASALVARALILRRAASSTSRAKHILLMAVLVALPWTPYAVVESQTRIFATGMVSPIQEGLRESGWSGEFKSLKVLYVTPSRALVYTVSASVPHDPQSGCYASTVELGRSQNAWGYRNGSELIVWSDTGSARGIIFPPYWGKGEW